MIIQKTATFTITARIGFCVLALALGFAVFAPKAFVQSNTSVRTRSGNSNIRYQPTPLPPAKTTIRGRVFYADTGRPVRRATLMLLRDGPGGGREFTGLTDNEGMFQIKNVPGGTYFPMINAPGVVTPFANLDFAEMRRSEGEALEEAAKDFEKITVDGLNDVEVQIPARRGAAIGGRVMYADGDPAIGVRVEIMRKKDDKYSSVISSFMSLISMFGGGGGMQTDDRGIYRFPGLPAGEYIVKVTENVKHTDDTDGRNRDGFMLAVAGGNSYLTIYYPDAPLPESAQPIKLELGQEISEINITIPNRDLHHVSGRLVSGKDKSPVKGARISLSREGENTSSIFDDLGSRNDGQTSDAAGEWSFKELPKGKYTLSIEPTGGEYTTDTAETYGVNTMYNSNRAVSSANQSPPKPRLAKKTQEFTVDDKDIADLVVELNYGAGVSGTAVVENSAAMPPTVSVIAADEDAKTFAVGGVDNYRYGDGANSKISHEFRIDSISEGKTYFTVSVNDTNYYVKSARSGAVDLLAGPVDLKQGDNLSDVRIILGMDTGRLKGKVRDQKDAPVKSARLLIVPTDSGKRKNASFYRTVSSDENGEFTTNLGPGEYAVIPVSSDITGMKRTSLYKFLDEAIKDAAKVTVEAGKDETVTVKK
jgi:5-hydroxyisourate hydrolase-like protein (transthyretin family)